MKFEDSIKIRDAVLSDAAKIASLSRETFRSTYYDHFAKDFTVESLENYLNLTFSIEIVQSEFRVEGSRFIIAENKEGQSIGYMKLSTQQAPPIVPGNRRLCIERIYLVLEYQGMGIGKKFIDLSIDYAREHGRDLIWLGCWDRNIPTLQFYKRMGFIQVGSDKFTVSGSSYADTDLILVKNVEWLNSIDAPVVLRARIRTEL